MLPVWLGTITEIKLDIYSSTYLDKITFENTTITCEEYNHNSPPNELLDINLLWYNHNKYPNFKNNLTTTVPQYND